MKKMIALTGVLAMMLFASCKDKKEDTPAAPATPPAAENPAPPPAPEPQVEEDGTSVKLNEDGVSVKNKDGDNESNVTITDEKKELEIKTD